MNGTACNARAALAIACAVLLAACGGSAGGTQDGGDDGGADAGSDAGSDGGSDAGADGGAAAPDGGPDFGKTCSGPANCAPPAVCFQFGTGTKLCTVACAHDADCPVGSAGNRCNDKGYCKP